MQLTMQRTLLSASLVLLCAASADTHPHVWADVTVTPLFDGMGRFAGVREQWTLDAAYTESVLPEIDVSKDGVLQDGELQAATRNGLWWVTSTYMTRLTVAGRPAARKDAEGLKVGLTDRLSVAFTLPLAEPQAITLGAGIDVFDPENYYAFQFAEPGIDPSLVPASCRATRREQPNLDPTAVMILKRLGLTADPTILSDPAAGFPVRVAIDCGSPAR
jgi:ABC-type uncharacterized transport system substrate-binding protein